MNDDLINIAIASYNKGKIKEFENIFKNTKYRAISPSELKINIETIENGKSFEENAIIKAKSFGKISPIPTLADDSGLEIDFLNKMPGIDSAIFLGTNASYKQRFEYILEKMQNVELNKRKARFVCSIAIFNPSNNKVYTVESCLEGIISFEAMGEGGFGYDPIFYIPEYKKTMAELNLEQKNKISHRALASQKVLKKLDEIFLI